jgi:hypothetical protein
MVGTTAERRGASGLWPLVQRGPGTGGWFATSRRTRVRERVQKHRRGNGWRVRVGARRPRRTNAEQLGGAAGVADVGERPRVHARERVRDLKNDPTLAPPGGKTPQRAASWLATAERRRARLGRGTERTRVGLFPFPRERVRGCTGAWV